MSALNHHQPAEPPVFKRTALFKDFAYEHGLGCQIAPLSVIQYASYKYWAISNGMNAVAGATQPEEKAYQAACQFFNKFEKDMIDFYTSENVTNPLDGYGIR